MHPHLPLDQILIGDCRELLKTLPDDSVHCVVTSPPYWGLRSYGTDPQVWANGHEPCVEHQWGTETRKVSNHNGQGGSTLNCIKPGYIPPYHEQHAGTNRTISSDTCSVCGAWRGELGLEPTPELFCEHLVQIFREVKRVLRDDGTLWLNLGDSYAARIRQTKPETAGQLTRGNKGTLIDYTRPLPYGLKEKDLVGIPWMVAFALRADGWYLRSDCIWAKPNPMPESVTDRPTKAHEYIFLLSKSQKYYYDTEAVKEDALNEGRIVKASKSGAKNTMGTSDANNRATAIGFSTHDCVVHGRNRRTVWTVDDERALLEWLTENYPDTAKEFFSMQHERKDVWRVSTHAFRQAHFATFPPKLIEPCILAGTSERGVCPKCGAPWERVIEKRLTGEILADGSIKQTKMSRRARADGSEIKSATSVFKTGMWNESQTTGWRATCACDAGEPVPAVVLDPFMGSGTTASVCISLKRNYIGFDLNPNYVEDIAQDRADTTPPPLFVL